MASVNKCILVGNLGKDPDTHKFPDGSVCNFSIATSEKWKDKSGNKQEKTSWHNIKAFGKLGEICQEYLKKGAQVYIEGAIEYRENDGKFYTDIKAFNMTMLGQAGSSTPTDPKKETTGSDDFEDDNIPFD